MKIALETILFFLQINNRTLQLKKVCLKPNRKKTELFYRTKINKISTCRKYRPACNVDAEY